MALLGVAFVTVWLATRPPAIRCSALWELTFSAFGRLSIIC